MRSSEVTVGTGERITLSWRRHKHARYLAEETDDGIITLTPAALVPAILRNPAYPTWDTLRKPAPPGDVKEKIRELPLTRRDIRGGQ